MTVEPMRRGGPLAAWAPRLAAVGITVDPFVAMAAARVDADAARQLGLPVTPGTWVERADGRAIWLGPDEWLVTDPTCAPPELEARLRAAVAGRGAVVDVSAQRVALRLRGAGVRDLLATGCALDLHPRAFPVGSAAQTLLGLAGVVLLALDDDGGDYGLLVRTSFSRYLADWLLDAAAGSGW